MTPSPAPKSRWRKLLDAAATAFALYVAYFVVLLGLVTALNIVSPPLADDPAVILVLSVVCAVVVLAPRILVPTILQRLRSLPEDSLTTAHTDDSVAPMIHNLRIRSRLFKLGAAAAFVLVVVATLLGFTVAQSQSTDGAITGTGVTALALLLFLLRTLASIYRHNMRLAAFYDSKADYLQAGGKTKGLDDADLLSLFSTVEVDIGWTEKLKGAFGPREQKSPN
jgi:hypothetical protein